MSTSSVLASNYRDLATFQLPLAVPKAIHYLRQLDEKVVMLALYKHYFPFEWASSTSPLPHNFDLTNIHFREQEFINLVNDRLFPLADCDWFGDEESCDRITIYPQNLSWYEEEIEDLDFGEQFLLSLIGCGYQTDDWQAAFGFRPNRLIDSESISWQKLDRLCQMQLEPLSFLFDVISLIDRSTGCIWLDITFEEYQDFSWSQSSVNYLATEWQVAQNYHTKMQQLNEWLDKSISNCKKVVKLWNQSIYD